MTESGIVMDVKEEQSWNAESGIVELPPFKIISFNSPSGIKEEKRIPLIIGTVMDVKEEQP